MSLLTIINWDNIIGYWINELYFGNNYMIIVHKNYLEDSWHVEVKKN